jgi:hypothetical protein
VRVASLSTLPLDGLPERARSLGILSTYSPTPCGLATFSAALAKGLAAKGAEVRVVRVVDPSDDPLPPTDQVVGHLTNGSRSSVHQAFELLNQSEVAVVQHEYGLYGGTDGDEVLEVL